MEAALGRICGELQLAIDKYDKGQLTAVEAWSRIEELLLSEPALSWKQTVHWSMVAVSKCNRGGLGYDVLVAIASQGPCPYGPGLAL